MKTKTCFMVSVLRIWHSSINVSTENTFRRLNSFFIRGVIFVWLDGPFSLLSCDWCGSYGSRILERWPWCNGRRWSRKIGLSSYTAIGTSVTPETHICNAWKMIIWIWTFLSLGFPSSCIQYYFKKYYLDLSDQIHQLLEHYSQLLQLGGLQNYPMYPQAVQPLHGEG